jgi:hypothetical protein
VEYLQAGNSLSLRELTRDPHNLKGSLPCMPFSIVRGENRIMLPSENELLVAGDEILFCGTEHGERMLSASMNNAYTLDYLITGRDKPRGYLFCWLENRFNRASLQP